MSDLLADVVAAHGGLERWRELTTMQASISSGGEFWGMKGLVQDPTPRRLTVTLHEERVSLTPFGAADQRMSFTPDRTAVEKLDGTVVAERHNPRAAFAGHELTTPWDALDRAYFGGYAPWTYLTSPFLLTMPGFEVTEIAPRKEDSPKWRGLRAKFPSAIASHSEVQEFFFDEDNLLRRHDYRVDIAGGFAAAQYVDDPVEFDGILVPTKRRAYRRDAEDNALRGQLMVAIDFSEIRFI